MPQPKPFLFFSQRAIIQHAQTPATPYLSYVYSTVLGIRWGVAQSSVRSLLVFHYSPPTTIYSLFHQWKQTRLSGRRIRNRFQLGILHAQGLGHLHFGAFQNANDLEGVDDTFALVVIVGDGEDLAG